MKKGSHVRLTPCCLLHEYNTPAHFVRTVGLHRLCMHGLGCTPCAAPFNMQHQVNVYTHLCVHPNTCDAHTHLVAGPSPHTNINTTLQFPPTPTRRQTHTYLLCKGQAAQGTLGHLLHSLQDGLAQGGSQRYHGPVRHHGPKARAHT